jgi:hypothetical protein
MADIAFDLDGVLIPDFNWIPDLSHQEFYQHTAYARPLLNPQFAFDVITARAMEHWEITWQWLQQLQRPPENLYMNSRGLPAAEFKYQQLRQGNYQVYVESDVTICAAIRELYARAGEEPNVKVLHFDEFVCAQLANVHRITP